MEKNFVVPLMKKVSEESERRINEGLKQYQLTLTQGKVVLFLTGKENHTASQKELEDFLEVSHPTTVTIVKSMMNKGMLQTDSDPDDKRMKLITLVWGNEEIYKELQLHAAEMEENVLKGFSKEEREIFMHLMKKAYHNLK